MGGRENERFDVVILGAGASGLMCALEAAARGRRVVVLDHAGRFGRKIRISGGGKCNFTNLGASAGDYVCGNPHFVKSALARYTPHDFLAFMERRGLPVQDMGRGMLFSRNATDVATALYDDATAMGARFRMGVAIHSVGKAAGGFVTATDQGEFRSESLVLALGGPAWPQAGATSFGHQLARSFGLEVLPPRPGLVPLTTSGEMLALCRAMSGNALPVRIACGRDGRFTPVAEGNLLFTHRGISGPAVLDASLFWRDGDTLSIDLLPGVNVVDQLLRNPKAALHNGLSGLLFKRFAQLLCERHQWAGQVGDISPKRLEQIEDTLHAYLFTPTGTEGFKKAEVTLGGIDTEHISSKTMEVKEVPGLYCIGEVLDVTGRLGGYNLQWAWSSGWVAGQYA